jgi:phosphopantothenoylcysteine decarboxylase/phosphopantothenate--cysteine ligase
MTNAATRFVTPLTFQALSGRPAAVDLFPAGLEDDGMQHITLARQADLVIVAPASADLIARAATGRADDLMTCVLLATLVPVLVAPAMNPAMWAHPMTQDNVQRLSSRAGYRFVGPASGEAACGEEGPGRMAEPSEIVEHAMNLLGISYA